MDKPDSQGVDEAQVERYFDELQGFARIAWSADIENLEALVERIRIALVIDKASKQRKVFYRGAIDYFEDVLEERHKKEERSAGERHHSIVAYFKSMADNLSRDE